MPLSTCNIAKALVTAGPMGPAATAFLVTCHCEGAKRLGQSVISVP